MLKGECSVELDMTVLLEDAQLGRPKEKATGPSRMALESEIPSASPMDLGLVTWWSELQWASMSTCL